MANESDSESEKVDWRMKAFKIGAGLIPIGIGLLVFENTYPEIFHDLLVLSLCALVGGGFFFVAYQISIATARSHK